MSTKRRVETKGFTVGDKVKISCNFPSWVFNYFDEKARNESISFNAAINKFIEEAVEIDLECSLDEVGLSEIADMDELKIKYKEGR